MGQVPSGLVAPSKSISAPFQFKGTPPSSISLNDEPTQPDTKGAAVTNKTAGEGSGFERFRSAFGFLDASPTIRKKRPAATEVDNTKQGDHQAPKKARKEVPSAKNPVQASQTVSSSYQFCLLLYSHH